MRRKTVIFLVLVVILAFGAVYVNMDINDLGDEAAYKLKDLYGDPEVLDGIELSMDGGFRYRFFWENKLRFDDGKVSIKSNDFHIDPSYGSTLDIIDPHEIQDLIRIDICDDVYTYCSFVRYWDEGIKTIGDELLSGDKNNVTFRLKDYVDFYTFSGELKIGFYNKNMKLWNLFDDEGISKYDDDFIAFNEFFRIPVLENEVYNAEIEKSSVSSDKYVNVSESDRDDCDRFQFYSYMEYINGKVYMFFNDRTSRGDHVDTSHIPGGYGIYSFGFKDEENKTNEPDMTTLRNVLKLEGGTTILDIIPASDDKHLEIFTIEGNKLTVRSLDTDTDEITDSEVVWDDMTGEEIERIFSYDGRVNKIIYSSEDLELKDKDLILVSRPEKGFAVISCKDGNSDTAFRTEYSPEFNPGVLGTKLGEETDTKVILKDGKAITVSLKHGINKDEARSDLDNVIISVYNKTGPEYIGILKGDLNKVVSWHIYDWYEDNESGLLDGYEYDDFEEANGYGVMHIEELKES